MCFPADRPTQVKAKGTTGKKYNQLLMMADNPHPFKVPLDKACCAEPLCCCAGTACAFFPFPSCYLRKQTLDKYGNVVGSNNNILGNVKKLALDEARRKLRTSPRVLAWWRHGLHGVRHAPDVHDELHAHSRQLRLNA